MAGGLSDECHEDILLDCPMSIVSYYCSSECRDTQCILPGFPWCLVSSECHENILPGCRWVLNSKEYRKITYPAVRGCECHENILSIVTFMYLWAIYSYIFSGSVCLCCSKISRLILGMYKSLTDTWTWKLGGRTLKVWFGNNEAVQSHSRNT